MPSPVTNRQCSLCITATMKFIAATLLCGILLVMAGCKPDAAIKTGAVIDQPTQKKTTTVGHKPSTNQPPQTKVQ